ncbi:MAG TPA: efflux RND transporter periplasmic adaptor subunit [Syntrophorhabdaceae bacterium]|nr:efflux RND transporter periplasmic adaptor subunit [Syntrophorhabdaceae bacterium]HQM80480.1 efflux RND transporter periplasmic adaptor subunit [Syntrophorhabdaceae bacterium]
MKKKILLIVGILVVAIAVIVVVSHLRDRKDDNVIALSGNVEVTEANIGFKIPGRLAERPVDEGQRVKKGDLLARLDSAEPESIVRQNRAALEEAETKLAELKAGSRKQEIGQAAANVDAHEAELLRIRKDYERAELLYKNGAISAAQYDAAKSSYDSRAAMVNNAREALSLVKEGPRKEDIRMAEHRVAQLSAALATSEERLKDTVLYAPFEGVILRKNAELGETVAQGTPVFILGDLDNPWIKVYVKEDKLGLVKPGQKAKVTTDTFKGKSYEGTVSYVSSEAEFTPKTVQTQEERVKLVFGVKVSVKNENWELKPGMPADVQIEVKGP